jgi:hypothetical protein
VVTVWLNSRCIGFFCELHGFGQSRFEIGYHSLTDTIGKKIKSLGYILDLLFEDHDGQF